MTDPHAPLDVDALVFDAYGTLFDVHSVTALAEAMAPAEARRCHSCGVPNSWNTRG